MTGLKKKLARLARLRLSMAAHQAGGRWGGRGVLRRAGGVCSVGTEHPRIHSLTYASLPRYSPNSSTCNVVWWCASNGRESEI